MRIIGFSKKWSKLKKDRFTTFRCQRRDHDWELNESVQVVYHPRSKEREILGVAQIVDKESVWIDDITELEAELDGFGNLNEMIGWLSITNSDRVQNEPMNKLTLQWIQSVFYEANR